MPPLRATALFCFLICYFTPNLHKWQAPIYDFVFSGVCFGRRFFFCPSPASSYTGRPLPFRCLHIMVVCTFSEAWSTLPLAGGRAQRVSAQAAPRLGSPWSEAERRVAPALPGARRPAGPERIATAYALLYDDGGAARLRGRDRERTGRNPLRPSGSQFVNLCKNCREHWCAGRWKNVPYCKN